MNKVCFRLLINVTVKACWNGFDLWPTLLSTNYLDDYWVLFEELCDFVKSAEKSQKLNFSFVLKKVGSRRNCLSTSFNFCLTFARHSCRQKSKPFEQAFNIPLNMFCVFHVTMEILSIGFLTALYLVSMKHILSSFDICAQIFVFSIIQTQLSVLSLEVPKCLDNWGLTVLNTRTFMFVFFISGKMPCVRYMPMLSLEKILTSYDITLHGQKMDTC